MDARTGGQTAIGMLNIAFGLMGVVMSLLLFAFGAQLQADLASSAVNNAPGLFITRMPTASSTTAALELILVVVWIVLAVSGIGVLRLAPWGRQVSLIAGVALFMISGAKIIDSGLSFIAVGFVGYAITLLAVFTRTDWGVAFSGVTAELDAAHDALLVDEEAEEARQAA